ncbi:MAG TPA: prepilin-type N-terminal cleavage/methylation domain-containing protein [Steroidobacteraceae bacterium]
MQRWRGRERGGAAQTILYRDEMQGEASVDRHGSLRPRRALAHNTEARWSLKPTGGFTLVEVLVALVVVALGLAALMVSVSGAAPRYANSRSQVWRKCRGRNYSDVTVPFVDGLDANLGLR